MAGMCYYFVRHDGKISGKLTGGRKYSEEAGGMEILCELKFTVSARKVRKLRQLLTDLNSPAVVVVYSSQVSCCYSCRSLLIQTFCHKFKKMMDE